MPVEAYLPHVCGMLETYGTYHVHVAADDKSVIEVVRHHVAMWVPAISIHRSIDLF